MVRAVPYKKMGKGMSAALKKFAGGWSGIFFHQGAGDLEIVPILGVGGIFGPLQ